MGTAPLGRILVVDDEIQLLEVLSEKLTHQGYDVAGYSAPRDALRALQERSFDLLLTDLMMPEMDGVALLRAGLEIDPYLVGIIMTGQATVQTAVEALKIGALDYVLKPFKTPVLLPVLVRALEVRRLRMENVQLRETMAIYDLCKAISFTTDLQTILDKVADAALAQCEAQEVSVMLPTADGTDLCIRSVRGPNREAILGERVPIDRGVAGWVARTQTPLSLEVDDLRFAPLRPRSDIRSAMSMPMLSGGKLVGVLNVNSTSRRQPFTPGQVKALSILASAGGAAIEGAVLLTQARESEARYRSIFEHAVEGISQTTPAGEFRAVNPALAHMLGYDSADQLVGSVSSAEQLYMNPDHRATFRQLLEQQDTVAAFETCFLRRDGEPIWVSLNGRAVRDTTGAIVVFECTAEDITERRQAEESLSLFRTLIDRSNDAIEVIDPDTGRFLDLNEKACESLGYSRDELLALCVPDVEMQFQTTGLSWTAAMEDVQQVGFKVLEGQHRRKNGSTFPVEVNVKYIHLNRGYLVAVVRDITERKQAEESLRQAEEKYRSIFNNAVEGIFQSVPEGRFLVVNPALARIAGYASPEEMIASISNIDEQYFVDPLRRMEFKRLLDEHDSVEGFEFEAYRKDGSKQWVSEHARAVRDQSGRLLYYEGIVQDITERKHLEAQFRQAQKMEAFGQLAGGVAHDFNNLLTIITGYSELLLSGGIPIEKQLDLVREIRRAGERAASLTRQLLAFSRKQLLQPVELDLNAVVADTEKMLRRLIGEDINLVAKLDPTLGQVKVDPGQVEQVIMNLAVNARDAMPNGGFLTIETRNAELDHMYAQRHPEVQPGPFVMLAVTDSGCGMDGETRSRIFEPFFTTKEVGKGTGLGLATVHGIVKQSGGSIEVYTEVGHGTTFTIYLPRMARSKSSRRSLSVERRLARGTETVLLAEDDDAVRTLARLSLETNGYTILEARSGEEAERIVREFPTAIHLLITDVVMPKIGGRQLAETLRSLRPELKVLYISGYTDDALVRQGIREDGTPFLQKPLTPTILALKVREVLDSQLPARRVE